MLAKKDYCKGFYQLLYKGNRNGVLIFDLVFTHSLTNNPKGDDNMNCDIVFEENIESKDLYKYVKKYKITRAIWFGNRPNSYVTPKDTKGWMLI